MYVLKVILLVSFVGLAVIVLRNRVSNPAMRIQFAEDLEKNKNLLRRTFLFASAQSKKRLRKCIMFLARFGNKRGRQCVALAKKIAPRFKKGFILFLRDIKRLFGALRSKFVQHAKELREDMKTFELPVHKEDFLERLHEETKIKVKEEEEKSLILQSPRKEERAKGFHVSKVGSEETHDDIEFDTHILEEKERQLLQAIEKNPKNPNFYKKLGKLYLQMGKSSISHREDAKNCFEYALKLGAQDPEIRALLAKM